MFSKQMILDEPNCRTKADILKTIDRSRRRKIFNDLEKLSVHLKRLIPRIPQITLSPDLETTMTSWAEDFTKAATWQLKNELAFWKSKALALEQENLILHRTLRQKSIEAEMRKKYPNASRASHVQFKCDLPVSDYEPSDSEKTSPGRRTSEPELEVSEEYIQFLRDNQVYRDFARQERERIKAQSDSEKRHIEEMEAGPSENAEDNQETLKQLYGDGWEKISALEMSLLTQCISIRDQDKPMYWPNIPFNFNFG